MKRLVLAWVCCLGLAGASYGQKRSCDTSAERAAFGTAGARSVEARNAERDARSRADREAPGPQKDRAEREAREASREAREAGRAAHEAGSRLDRAERECRRH
jgi:hypothetical protein